MKRMICILVALMFSVGLVPVFAADQTAPARENNLIKSVEKSVKEYKYREQDKIKTAKTVPAFQNASNYLKEGQAKAKQQSLRKTATAAQAATK